MVAAAPGLDPALPAPCPAEIELLFPMVPTKVHSILIIHES